MRFKFSDPLVNKRIELKFDVENERFYCHRIKGRL